MQTFDRVPQSALQQQTEPPLAHEAVPPHWRGHFAWQPRSHPTRRERLRDQVDNIKLLDSILGFLGNFCHARSGRADVTDAAMRRDKAGFGACHENSVGPAVLTEVVVTVQLLFVCRCRTARGVGVHRLHSIQSIRVRLQLAALFLRQALRFVS